MKIISNYKNIEIRSIFNFFFKTKKRTLLSILFLESLILLLIAFNFKYIYRFSKYIRNYNLGDITLYIKELTTSFDFKNEVKRIDLNIDFKNTTILNCLRQRKNNCKNSWAKGYLKFDNIDYPIKLKAKGDRDIHRLDFKTMSFKIDIRGEQRLLGMEEFSLQRPIIRGYTSEKLAADLLKENNIISPRNFYFKLFINGEYLGIRHLEESFSRELIEANERRYGPVFSLDENVGTVFGNTKFEVADLRKWENKQIYKDALTLLENTQQNPNLIKQYFDMNLWAEYFALMDILSTYHGILPKSVKFYLNPTTSLIEPAFFDGHQGTGRFDNFLLVDFTNDRKKEILCGHMCPAANWIRLFFMEKDQIDINFYKKYYSALERFSSIEFEEKSINKKIIELSPIRGVLYRNFSMYDDIFNEGVLPHMAKITYLKNRLINIRKNIQKSKTNKPFIAVSNSKNEITFANNNSQLPQLISIVCPSKKSEFIALKKGDTVKFNLSSFSSKCNLKNASYTIDKFKNIHRISEQQLGNLDFQDKLINKALEEPQKLNKYNFVKGKQSISTNLRLKNKLINLNNNLNLCIENDAVLEILDSKIINQSKDKKLSIKGCGKNPGSVVIKNSKININELDIKNLSAPKKHLSTLYGGLNIIKSEFKAKKLKIEDSLGEDGINFIESNVEIDIINAKNIQSDAIDSDSSKLIIKEVFCENISNDCVDLSYSQGNFEKITAKNIKDKAISIGEKSSMLIKNLKVFDSAIGLVAKDSSYLKIKNFYESNVELPIAAFIKKEELGSPQIIINNLNENSLNNILISNDSNVSISGKKLNGNYESDEISNMLYGNIYGIKTIR